MQRLRILRAVEIEGLLYNGNDVVDLDAVLADPLLADGTADADEAAVAYCTDELQVEPVVHVARSIKAAEAALAELQVRHEEVRAVYEAENDAGTRAALGKQADAIWEDIQAAEAKIAELRGR